MTWDTELGVKQRKNGVKFWGGKERGDGRPASLLEIRPGSS